MGMADILRALFLVAFALMLGLSFWLIKRQFNAVRAHRHAVPAAFVGRISLAAHQKAADYTQSRLRLRLVALLFESALLLVFTFGGGLAWLAGLWQGEGAPIWRGLGLILSYLALSGALDLPFALWRQFVLEERFGFNRMTLRLFVADLVKGALLGLCIGAPLILAILWLIAAAGEFWWFYAWIFWCLFSLALFFVWPSFIAPLFNRFSPFPDGASRAAIQELLARCGFPEAGLLVMDGSKRSAHGNAYFTGFGRNRRIVFFDTLLARLGAGELVAVLAHELGHYRLHHVKQRLALAFAGSLFLLAVLGSLVDAPWFFSALGVADPALHGQALALLLFFLVAPVFTFLLTPLTSLLSRQNEFAADRYAARQSSAADLIAALVKLYEDNAATLTPDAIYSLFYDSHPPAAIRIARLQEAA